jgi:hypothetical protein
MGGYSEPPCQDKLSGFELKRMDRFKQYSISNGELPMANTTHSSPPEKRPFLKMKKILNARNTLFHIHNVWTNRQE